MKLCRLTLMLVLLLALSALALAEADGFPAAYTEEDIADMIGDSGLSDEYTFADPGAIADAMNMVGELNAALDAATARGSGKEDVSGWLGRALADFDADHPGAVYATNRSAGDNGDALCLMVEDGVIVSIDLCAEGPWSLMGYYVGMPTEDYMAFRNYDQWTLVEAGSHAETVLDPAGNYMYAELTMGADSIAALNYRGAL